MLDSLALVLPAFLGGAAAVGLLWLRDRQSFVRDAARLEAERNAAEASADDQREALTQSNAQLRDAFAHLSQSALRENRQDFLHDAGQLLQPVRETLSRVQAQLAEVDKAREGSFREVTTQLSSLAQAQEQLRAAADGLSRSLRSPNVRGKWGEVQLRRIVELAGMLGQCDFVEKESATNADGARQTPDLIVKLPGDTSIVIDSKVPIEAYLASTNARSEAERLDLLASHARQVREHVRTLGAKEYWKQFEPAPEFVVMFLPLEPLLSAAFEQDGALLEQAATARVIPATPMTLLALLKAVSYGWKQQQLADNAEEIRQIGRELYDRLTNMVGHLSEVGRGLTSAAQNYDRFIGSLEQKVLPGARRFKDLGVISTKELEVPERLRLQVRRVEKPELTLFSDKAEEKDRPA
ncbi:MAG TPA: DNA recombination protein RmuC [Vicinamibacterales bacterium]|jgi:DNA recombination protein RmuC